MSEAREDISLPDHLLTKKPFIVWEGKKNRSIIMSQLVHIQRNDFRGEINNFGGTFVTGAVFNSGGGNIFIGGRQTQDAWGIGQDILEREGLCVLSLGMSVGLYLLSSFRHWR